MSQAGTLQTYGGTEVEVEHIEPRPNGAARFDIEAEDGRKWRVDVGRDGEVDVVTTWRDGVLADLEVPEWMDDVTARLARV